MEEPVWFNLAVLIKKTLAFIEEQRKTLCVYLSCTSLLFLYSLLRLIFFISQIVAFSVCSFNSCLCESYVYWTVHHLDSWIKRDQLDVTCFFISLFNAQHVSDVNTSIIRSLRLICWVISWVSSGFSLHPDTTPPQPNHNVTPTHIVPEQYNPWHNSTNKSQALEDGCINIRNMLSIK